MHISEGLLSPSILLSGCALTAAGTAMGVRSLSQDRIPITGVMTASFFVASVIRIPIFGTSVHLLLNGLLGVFLGWASFPAILVALMLQTLLFQYGDPVFTTIGVNVFCMAMPAVAVGALRRPMLRADGWRRKSLAFLAGFLGVFLAAVLSAAALVLSGGNSFRLLAKALLILHVHIMILEGIMTSMIVSFICKVRPGMLGCTGQRVHKPSS